MALLLSEAWLGFIRYFIPFGITSFNSCLLNTATILSTIKCKRQLLFPLNKLECRSCLKHAYFSNIKISSHLREKSFFKRFCMKCIIINMLFVLLCFCLVLGTEHRASGMLSTNWALSCTLSPMNIFVTQCSFWKASQFVLSSANNGLGKYQFQFSSYLVALTCTAEQK